MSGYLAQSEKGEIKVSEKIKNLWTEKLEATSVILTVLEDAEKPDSELDGNAHANRVAFYKTAKQAWEINLGGKLLELSKEMVGTYALGKLARQLIFCGSGKLMRVVQATSFRLQIYTLQLGSHVLFAFVEGVRMIMGVQLRRRLRNTLRAD